MRPTRASYCNEVRSTILTMCSPFSSFNFFADFTRVTPSWLKSASSSRRPSPPLPKAEESMSLATST